MFGTKKKDTNLVGEDCFHLWVQGGSLSYVMKQLILTGIINPQTRKPYTRVSVCRKAWYWAADHIPESLKYMKESHSPYSQGLEMEQWIDNLAYHVKINAHAHMWRAYLRKNPDWNTRAERYRSLLKSGQL